EFLLAGWKPEFWSAADLLSRTDAFTDAVNPERAAEPVSDPKSREVVADAIPGVGAPPFFVALAGRIERPGRERPGGWTPATDGRPWNAAHSVAVRRGPTASTRDGTLSFSDDDRGFHVPSTRYFVRLHAPGWNVIGATRPWLPGVAVGHNDRIAWGL